MHSKFAVRMLAACTILGIGILNSGCRGIFFVDRAYAPSGDNNAGDYHLAGVVADASGKPINGVTLTITSTIRYYGKRTDNEIPPWFTGDDKEVRTVDGEFSVEEFNAVGVTLLFEKDGFAPVSMHFATYEEQGAPVIHQSLRITLRNATH